MCKVETAASRKSVPVGFVCCRKHCEENVVTLIATICPVDLYSFLYNRASCSCCWSSCTEQVALVLLAKGNGPQQMLLSPRGAIMESSHKKKLSWPVSLLNLRAVAARLIVNPTMKKRLSNKDAPFHNIVHFKGIVCRACYLWHVRPSIAMPDCRCHINRVVGGEMWEEGLFWLQKPWKMASASERNT